MSATALSLAAILALAGNPRCGAAEPGSEFAQRLAAIALQESGGDPLVIGVNADLVRRLPASVVRSDTAEEAATKARALAAQRRSFDLGLMQINVAQLARHGLTIETAFDACRNIAAGADHYADDVRAVWTLAHRVYNTGSTERGQRYAAEVEQVLARVKRARVDPSEEVAAAPARPAAPPDPSEPPAWDIWAHDEWERAKGPAQPPPPPAAPSPSPHDASPEDEGTTVREVVPVEQGPPE